MPRVLCTMLAMVLTIAPAATADPLVLTSGFITFTDEPGDFVLTGRDFDVRGSWFPRVVNGTFWHDACQGCSPGTLVDFGVTTYAFSTDRATLAGGSVGGVAYSELFFDSVLTFSGPRVIAPSLDPADHTRAVGPFALAGSIAVYADEARSGAPLFAANLRGSGTAQVFFGSAGAGDLLLNDLVYVFEDQAPVPEPSTLLLLGTGLAAAAARRTRRASRRGTP